MRSLALSDLNRRPGEVVDMALAAPVMLTKHGRRAVVMMSAEAYDSLVSGGSVVQVSVPESAKPKTEGPSFLARQARKIANEEHEGEGH
jgi:prevent-host-death family protein